MARIRSDTGARYEIELGQMPLQLGQNPPLTNPSRQVEMMSIAFDPQPFSAVSIGFPFQMCYVL